MTLADQRLTTKLTEVRPAPIAPVERRDRLISHFAANGRVGDLVGRRRTPTVWERLPHTRQAIAFAQRRHAGQSRSDGTAFILHPLEVGSLLYYTGAPDYVIAAGVMHDLIEKADVSAADMRTRFGAKITELVLAVSDDDRIKGYARRKAALRRQVAGAGEEALTVFAADKLSKVRELRREVAADSETAEASGRRRQVCARRLRHYERSLALLEERLAQSPLIPQLRDEFRSLETELREPALAASL